MVACGALRTVIVNERLELSGRTPLSVTRTVMLLVLGACAREGVQVKSPPAVMAAPLGKPASRLKLKVCGGTSASVAVAVKLEVWPNVMVRSEIGSRMGAVPPAPMVFGPRGVGVVM